MDVKTAKSRQRTLRSKVDLMQREIERLQRRIKRTMVDMEKCQEVLIVDRYFSSRRGRGKKG